MENLVGQDGFWENRRVFVTGHTGFKGSWLSLWLKELGARVFGYALAPQEGPSLFIDADIGHVLDGSIMGDILDAGRLAAAIEDARPEVVFHLAAQSLVCVSYEDPIGTYATNVIGTANLLESVRGCPSVRAVVNVTTDKVYENREWVYGYRECDPLGGFDPYSSSKACSELVSAAYRDSFFNATSYDKHGIALATARAGNVIGGGDWARDRLIPDSVRAFARGEPVRIRSPRATRPWQHVLEPLSGYLALARMLCLEGPRFSGAWNFGPRSEDVKPVGEVVQTLAALWGNGARSEIDPTEHPHEAGMLYLESAKARTALGWAPRWSAEVALQETIRSYKAYYANQDLLALCRSQIRAYSGGAV